MSKAGSASKVKINTFDDLFGGADTVAGNGEQRISVSKYQDKFILKGGMLVAAMVGLDARATMDIDATIKGADVNVEAVENIITDIVSVPLEDGVTFRIKQISEVMDEADYPGVRVSMRIRRMILIRQRHLRRNLH